MKMKKRRIIANSLSITIVIIIASCRKDEVSTNIDTSILTTTCSTSGTVAQSTNAEIETLRQAFLAFRVSLGSTLLENSTSCLGSDRFTKWHNTPGTRDGITYADLSTVQIDQFKSLLQLVLSTEGYGKVDEITTLSEGFLSEINSIMWNPNKYSIDMFGDPENDGSWGFQLDGHHCAINFLVHGNNVSIVPAFLGAEPVTGIYNGISFDIFEDERDLALILYDGFSGGENAVAVINGNSAIMELGPAVSNGDVDSYAGSYDYSGFETGLKYSNMSTVSQANLIILMKEYVYNLNTSFADQWWNDISANIDDTYFVWVDNVNVPNATSQFYYRIYNPYLWVEYNMEDPVGMGIDQWNHAHTITRIPNNPGTENGGDYGVFAQIMNNDEIKFLAQHYEQTDHHETSFVEFDYRLINEHKHNDKSHKH
ncbi:MAG: hypothetical protein ACI8Q1_001782 [Parvicella sp.]|jgi:hypothetical protein